MLVSGGRGCAPPRPASPAARRLVSYFAHPGAARACLPSSPPPPPPAAQSEAGFADLDADARSSYLFNTTIAGVDRADAILLVRKANNFCLCGVGGWGG